MATQGYEAVFILKKTKKKLKLLAVKKEMTFDQLINELMK